MDDLFLNPVSESWATPDPHRSTDIVPVQPTDESSLDLYGDLSMSSIRSGQSKTLPSPEKQPRRHFSRIADAKRQTSKEYVSPVKVQSTPGPAQTCDLDLYTEHLMDELSLKQKFKNTETLNVTLQKELRQVTSQNDQLRKNISSLFLTAKQEIQEKDREIAKLRAMMERRSSMTHQLGSTERDGRERLYRSKDNPGSTRRSDPRDRKSNGRYNGSVRKVENVNEPSGRRDSNAHSAERKRNRQSPTTLQSENSSIISGLDQGSEKRKYELSKSRDDPHSKMRKKENISKRDCSDSPLDKATDTLFNKKGNYQKTDRKRDDLHKKYPDSETQEDSKSSKNSQKIANERYCHSNGKESLLSAKERDASSPFQSSQRKVELPVKQSLESENRGAVSCSDKPKSSVVDSPITDLRQKLKKRKFDTSLQSDHRTERETKRSKTDHSEEVKNGVNSFADNTIQSRQKHRREKEFISPLKDSSLRDEDYGIQQKLPEKGVEITMYPQKRNKVESGVKNVTDMEARKKEKQCVNSGPTVTQTHFQKGEEPFKVPRRILLIEATETRKETSSGKTKRLSNANSVANSVKTPSETSPGERLKSPNSLKALSKLSTAETEQSSRMCSVAKSSELTCEPSSGETEQSSKNDSADNLAKTLSGTSSVETVQSPIKCSGVCLTKSLSEVKTKQSPKVCVVDTSVKTPSEFSTGETEQSPRECSVDNSAKLATGSSSGERGQLSKDCSIDNNLVKASSESSSGQTVESPIACYVHKSLETLTKSSTRSIEPSLRVHSVDISTKVPSESSPGETGQSSIECLAAKSAKSSKETSSGEMNQSPRDATVDNSLTISTESSSGETLQSAIECPVNNSFKTFSESFSGDTDQLSKDGFVNNSVKLTIEPGQSPKDSSVDDNVKSLSESLSAEMLQLPKKCSVGNSTFNEISSVEAVLSQKTLREQGCIKAIQESNNIMLKETRRRHPSNNPDHVSKTEFERTEKPTCEVGSAGIVGLVNKHDSSCTAQEFESGVAAKALGECAPSSARDSTGAVALRSGANSEQFKTNSVSSRSPDSKPRELLSKSSEKHTFAVVAKNSMGSWQDMESAKVLTELENESQIDNKEELTTGGCLFDAVARTSGGEVANGFAFLGPDISNQESNSIASMFSVPFRNLKSVGGNSVSNINSTNSTWPFEASNSNHNSGINSVWSTNSKSQTMPFSQSNDSNSKKLSKVDGNIHLKKYVTDDQNNSSAVKDKRAFPISSFGEKQDEKIGTLEVSSEKNVEPETENEENSGDSASSSSSKNSRDSDDSTSASSSSRPSSGIPDCIVADKDGSNESASSQSSASQGGSRSVDCEDSSKTKSDDNLGKSSSNVSLDGSSSESPHTPHKARPADVSEMEIVCTSNLIMLGDEDTTCTTFASPSKPALLPSEFYPPGVRGKIYEGGSHSRHIRGGSELLFKPIRLVCQEGDDDDHTECKTICEENEDPTVISDDSSSRDSDVVLQKVEGPQSKSPETSSAPTKPILVFTDNSHDCQIVSTKTESMVSPFNFLKKEDIHNKNLTTKCAQKIHEDNTMMLRKIQGTSTSDTCHKNSEKKNEIKLTSPPMTDETDEVQRRASFDAWKETVHRTYLSVFQQELKTFKEKLMEEVMSKAHQAAQEERRKDLEKLQSAVQQFIRSNVSKSPCRGVEVTAPLETLPEEAISVSLASEQVASAQTHACGSNSAISCQSVPGVNGTKTPISESPASQQVCHSLCSMPPINKSVKKNRNSNNSSDLRGVKKEDHLESTTGRKKASGTYRIRRCSSNTDSPSTHSGDRQFDNCSKTSCHNQTKILKTQVLMNGAHCVWRASPDSCVVTSSDSDKKASTSASKACLDDTREMATFDTDLLGEPDSTSDCCCREVLKRNPPSTKNKLGSGNGKLDVIVPVSNKSESKAQAKIKGNSHRALSVSGKSLESVESQVNVSKSDRMSTTHKALLDGAVNTQEHNKPKSAKVKQPQQPDKPVPKRVQHSDTANVIQQHVELFSDKRDVAQQPDRSMTKRTDIIQQPYTSRDDGTNIVQQPDKAMINSNNMTEIVKQPDKLIDNGTMVNVVQQYDNSMTNRTSILQQPGKSIDDRAMTTAKKITKEEKMSNKMIPEETSKAHQPLPTIIDISQQPDKLILSNKPFSVKNSTPKRPNIVTSPKHVSDEPSMSPVSNKSIHAIESAVTPIKNSSFFLHASPIIDECSQFPSPDKKIPHILNSVSAESTLNLTFTTHKFSDGHMEDSDMETTLVNINHRNEQGETVKLPFDEVSLCSNSLSEFDRDMAQSTPRSERVAKEQMPRFSPMQHLNSSKSATRSFSQVSETQITSGVGKKSRKAERSRNDLKEEKVSLTQALNNTSEPKGNAHSSKSVAGSLPNKNDTRSNGEKEKADLTKHSSEVSSQSLKQNSSTKESSVEDYEETPDGFHSDSDNVLSKHLTYQELHKMGLVKSFFCEDVPYSSPINVLESTIEESEESFVTCPQLSSEEVMFIENVQKVRKNLSRELESNKGTVQSCSEKMPDQAPATYVFSPASSMDRTLSSDLHMSESESDGFPTPIKKGTVPGAVDRSQEQRPQAHGSTASQEKSHLTRGSDLNSQIQVTSKHFDDPELMEEVDKTLVEDDIVFLPPLEELAPKDETLEDGEIDDDDDNNDGDRKETYAVKSNANNVASSSSSKTYRSNFDNSELKKSEHIGKAHAVRNRNIIGRVGGRVLAGIGKSESLVSPLERVYCKQNTSGDGYNTGKVNPALHVNRKNSSTDSIKRQNLISEKDRRSGGRGRSGKRSEKMVCGNKAYATETRRISTTGTRNEHCQDRSGSRISHNQEDAPNTQNSPGLDNQNQRDSRGRIKARPRNSYTDGSVCRSSNGVERSQSRNYGRERPQSRNATRETERPRSRNASRETERPRSRNLPVEAERLHLKNAARETERPQPRNLSRERPNSRNSDRKRHSSKNSQRERPSSRNSCSSEHSYDRN